MDQNNKARKSLYEQFVKEGSSCSGYQCMLELLATKRQARVAERGERKILSLDFLQAQQKKTLFLHKTQNIWTA